MASVKNPYEILCPKCREAGSVELYEVADAGEEPSLREALMSDQLNVVQCGACAYRFRVNKPLVYRDQPRSICLAWIPGGEADPAAAESAARRLCGGDDTLQVVYERVELVERLFVLEAGLDARLVEYAKHLIFSKNPAKLDPSAKRLLFNAQDSTADHLSFVVQDVATHKLESLVHYPRATFQGISEAFAGEEGQQKLKQLFAGPAFAAARLLK